MFVEEYRCCCLNLGRDKMVEKNSSSQNCWDDIYIFPFFKIYHKSTVTYTIIEQCMNNCTQNTYNVALFQILFNSDINKRGLFNLKYLKK